MKTKSKKSEMKQLSPIDQKILECLEKDPRMPITEIARKINVSRVTVSNHLKRLRSENLIQLLFTGQRLSPLIKKSLQVERIPTRIGIFDSYIGGGLPRGSMLVLYGEIGSGTSTFCQHLAWNLINNGYRCFYFSLFQLEDEIRQQMFSFGWDVRPFEKSKHLMIRDSFQLMPPPDEMLEYLMDKKKTFQVIWEKYSRLKDVSHLYFKNRYPDFVIIDSLERISHFLSFEYWQVFWDLVIQFGKSLQITGIGVFHPETVDSKILAYSKSISDALLTFEKEMTNNTIQRSLLIERFPFTNHFSGKIPFKITSSGITFNEIEEIH
ncbi:MAG: ATPase domain-containing protein [Candidatus Helarchaeota archaeon]